MYLIRSRIYEANMMKEKSVWESKLTRMMADLKHRKKKLAQVVTSLVSMMNDVNTGR